MSDLSAHILAMLTTKGIEIGKPFGGIPKITVMDVAGSLAGLDIMPYLLMRGIYVDDAQDKVYFLQNLSKIILRRWECPESLKTMPMAMIALDHALGNIHCKPCRGRGVIYPSNAASRPCETCGGSGKGTISKRAQAHRCGIAESTFRDTWYSRVQEIQTQISGWEVKGLEHVARRLFA